MPNRWLLKTEPSTYSFADLQRERRTVWDGVKNAMALKNLRQMRKGDALLVYHTGEEKVVVGIAKAVSDPYPDPERNDEKLVVLDIAPEAPLKRPVSLAEVKANAALKAWELARLPRLSVLPVTAAQWKEIERMAASRPRGSGSSRSG